MSNNNRTQQIAFFAVYLAALIAVVLDVFVWRAN